MAIEDGLVSCIHGIYSMLTVLCVILTECRLDLVACVWSSWDNLAKRHVG